MSLPAGSDWLRICAPVSYGGLAHRSARAVEELLGLNLKRTVQGAVYLLDSGDGGVQPLPVPGRVLDPEMNHSAQLELVAPRMTAADRFLRETRLARTRRACPYSSGGV